MSPQAPDETAEAKMIANGRSEHNHGKDHIETNSSDEDQRDDGRGHEKSASDGVTFLEICPELPVDCPRGYSHLVDVEKWEENLHVPLPDVLPQCFTITTRTL